MVGGFAAELDDEEVKAWLKQLSAKLKKISDASLPRLAAKFGTVIFADIMRHFADQKGPSGAWPAWSKLYRNRQDKLGKSQGSNMLKMTGRLRNSFSPTNYRRSSDALLWYNPATTTKGFPYAYAHDNDDESRKQLPQRKFMWISRDAFDKLAMITLEELVDT
jgi:phage gpG-like protein